MQLQRLPPLAMPRLLQQSVQHPYFSETESVMVLISNKVKHLAKNVQVRCKTSLNVGLKTR